MQRYLGLELPYQLPAKLIQVCIGPGIEGLSCRNVNTWLSASGLRDDI